MTYPPWMMLLFRRGFETIHITYDEATAILVGDALNSEAFYRIAKAPLRDDIRVKLVEVLARDGGTYGMVLGQAIDLYFENMELTIDEVKFLHKHKTAKLIATSLLMGAIIVNLDRAKQQELYSFGIDLGLLFQIQDDILDVTHSDQEAGKPTNSDTDKNSFVKILGLEGSIAEANTIADSLNSKTR